VIGHAAEGAYEGGAEAEYSVVLNDENTLLSERCSTAIPMVLRGPNTQHYVGKADGEESIRQRWHAYATNGHGGNVELKDLDPSHFRFSLLRVFDPATPTRDINAAESHFKEGLDSIRHGLNRN
tara:strand:+ start:509 stop:880 length:372 start_codon:yes stop_codon:yes gene_type:complete